jgi:hypothetical protein
LFGPLRLAYFGTWGLATALGVVVLAGCPGADCEAVAQKTIALRTQAQDVRVTKSPDKFRTDFVKRCQAAEPPKKLQLCVDKAQSVTELFRCNLRDDRLLTN